jgi:P-type conjugative transfer protein TrbJ
MPLNRLVCIATFVVASAVALPAKAQWAVLDPTNLVQNTLTAAKAAQVVINTYEQIERMKDQIKNQVQTLKSLDPRSFNSVKSILENSEVAYSSISGNLDSIGYSVNDVNRNFNQLFPKKQADWKNVKASDFSNYYDRWNAEVTSSSLAASRSQASITTLEKNNQAISAILSNANSDSSGEVRQLQLVNQQLAIIHKELTSLVQSLDTMGRVISTWAASSVGEKMLGRETKQRRIQGYTDRGAPSRVLNKMP